jgi:S-adenosylmethionine decarboxylase proenzyme
MRTVARHLLAEYRGCPPERLDDVDAIERLMRAAAAAAGATVLDARFRRFAPHGVSGVLLLLESHLSIHTWPEEGYAAVDLYTCGDCVPEAAHRVLLAGLAAGTSETMVVARGLAGPGPLLQVSGG